MRLVCLGTRELFWWTYVQTDRPKNVYKYNIYRWSQVITGVEFDYMAAMQGTHHALHPSSNSNRCCHLVKEGLVNLNWAKGIELGSSALHASVLSITLRTPSCVCLYVVSVSLFFCVCACLSACGSFSSKDSVCSVVASASFLFCQYVCLSA